MKNTYKITVGTSSTQIAPDLNIQGVSDWVKSTAYSVGDYVKNPDTDFIYWATTAGTSVSAPTHTKGISTVETTEWLAITPNRDMIISADEDAPVFIADEGTAIIDEGLKLDVYRPAVSYERFTGSIYAISATSATISVKLR